MTRDEDESKRVLEDAVRAAAGGWREQDGGTWADPEIGDERAEPASAERAQAAGLTGFPMGSLEALAAKSGGGGMASRIASWLNPLAGGLMGLFGGGEDEAEVELPKFRRPSRMRYEAGFRGAEGGLVEIDRDERGQAREARPPAQVVVNVEAMDSRSFLDRTPEISEAIKRALLESDGLSRLMERE